MTTVTSVGRTVGVLLIVQMTAGYVTNFVLLEPAIAPPGFLVNAAPHATSIGVAALVGIVSGAFGLAIAVTMLPVVRKLSERMALSLLALGTVGLALAVVESAKVMSMLSLSQAYAATNGADPAAFAGLRGVVAASRNWAHFSHLLISGTTLSIFYAALYRFTLVPRVLAAAGLFAAALQIATISLPFFGGKVIFPLLAPLGLANLAVAIWLIVKGCADPDARAASRAAAADSRARSVGPAPRS
jgi:hypothetical protein